MPLSPVVKPFTGQNMVITSHIMYILFIVSSEMDYMPEDSVHNKT